MDCIEISALEQIAKSELIRLDYRRSAIGRHSKEWREFFAYCAQQGIESFDSDTAAAYFRYRYDLDIQNVEQALNAQQLNTRNSLRMLDEILTFGYIRRYFKAYNKYPAEYTSVIQGYLSECGQRGLAEGTLHTKDQKLFPFIERLMRKGCLLQDISPTDISEHVLSLASYSRATAHIATSTLRDFMRYLYETGVTAADLSPAVPRPKLYAEEGLPITWTDDEVSRLLGAIDRHNPIGKRDYAMILLAVMLGMRVGDICNLRFGNLDWKVKTISFVQQKTGKSNTLPLLPLVGDAIIDYLKNGRVAVETDIIFVRHIHPYGPFQSSSVLTGNIKRYMRYAGLMVMDRKTMHSLRHTLASNLLKNGASLLSIADALGQVNPASAAWYTKVDLPSLRKCALSYSSGGDGV